MVLPLNKQKLSQNLIHFNGPIMIGVIQQVKHALGLIQLLSTYNTAWFFDVLDCLFIEMRCVETLLLRINTTLK